MLRKTTVLLTAILLAFLLTELLVYYVIAYPKYLYPSKYFKISEKASPYSTLRIRPPYFSTWVSEGAKRAVRFNNVGLPGPDVNEENEKIFLLGNSFIEAIMYADGGSATHIFQEKLKNNYPEKQILNLGSSGNDPYPLWFRANFFEERYRPETVFLVVESFGRLRLYFKRFAHPLDFTVVKSSPLPDSKLKKYAALLREHFAFLNLICSEMGNAKVNNQGQKPQKSKVFSEYVTYQDLQNCLLHFQGKYGSNLIFVSIMQDNPYQIELANFCRTNNINYFVNTKIMKPENRINGKGHLNLRGNSELGEFLYESFTQLAK